jgi:transcriptional regulator with XRE-family HTH domain
VNQNNNAAGVYCPLTSKQKVGEKIRILRKIKRMSLAKLAKYAKLSPSYLWLIEQGRATQPRATHLLEIGKILGITVEQLYDEAFVVAATLTEEQQAVQRLARAKGLLEEIKTQLELL